MQYFTITIDKTKVGGNLTKFPFLFTELCGSIPSGFWDHVTDQTDGLDIRFLDTDALTELKREIVLFDPVNQKVEAWVQIPALTTSTDKVIYCTYNQATAANTAEVWTDMHAVRVHHLQGDVADSASGTTSVTNAITEVDSKIQKGYQFSASNTSFIAPTNVSFGYFPAFSCWVKPDPGIYQSILISKGTFVVGNSIACIEYWNLPGNVGSAWLCSSSLGLIIKYGPSIMDGQWHHFFGGVKGGGVNHFYVDGVSYGGGTGIPGAAVFDQYTLQYGRNIDNVALLNGVMDEIRAYAGDGNDLINSYLSSTAYPLTEYNNQGSPETFFSCSEEVGVQLTTESRKASRILFFSKEEIAGTADTSAFFEGRSCEIDFPEPVYLREDDDQKIGAGEHGGNTDTQAVYTPFIIKCSRFSEIAYLLSYALGTADSIATIEAGAIRHNLIPQDINSRTMPTFTMCYGNELTQMSLFTHCIVNDAIITLSTDGNGVCEAEFSGFCNLHHDDTGVISINGSSDQINWTPAFITTIEPLINFRSCKVMVGEPQNTIPVNISTVNMLNCNLSGSYTEISTLLDSITIGIDNGFTGEDIIRAGGHGVINCQERGDREITIELKTRRNLSVCDFRQLIDADTPRSIELKYIGAPIAGTSTRYAIDMIFPKINILDAVEEGDDIIETVLPCEVFQNDENKSLDTYWQSSVAIGYNSTIG